MYPMFKMIHSLNAYLCLLTLLAAIIICGMAFFNKSNFGATQKRSALMGLIFTHLQILLGLAIYFMSPYYQMLKSDFASSMKEPMTRLIAMEHPLTNILAVIFITIGYSRHKKQVDDVLKSKSIFVFYTIGVILLLSRIPYSNWLG
jgi:Na+-transporting methylmalonyl-CoA/oxaloacetate decarboxylase gamma subunit